MRTTRVPWLQLALAAAAALLMSCAGSRRAPNGGILATANEDARFGPASLSVSEIQSQVMSFTETFISVAAEQWGAVEQAALVATGPPAPEERDPEQAARAAHEIKLANVAAAVSIASTPNPIVAVADLITMISLQRQSLEDPWAAQLFGPQVAASLASAYAEQEAAARRIGGGVFFPAQERELLDLIDKWRREHPGRRYVSGVRIEDFGRDRSQVMLDEAGSPGGLFALVEIDNATREVERSRLLGERVFFYVQHIPTILRWQAESVYLGAVRTPQVRQAIASMVGFTAAAASLSRSVDDLPQDLRAEREAALEQFFQGVTEQRKATLEEIDQGQSHLQGSLHELRAAVEATDALAARLAPMLNTVNALADRLAPPGQPAPSGPPRDLLAEYRAAADATAQTADRLTALTERIDRLLASPAVNGSGLPAALASVQTSAQQVVDHAFWRLLIVASLSPLIVLGTVALAKRLLRAKRPAQ